MCTETSYYYAGWEIDPQSDIELEAGQYNRLLEEVFNSLKVYGDGVELPLFKSSNGERNFNVAELVLYKDYEYWDLKLMLNAGGSYENPFNTIRACAVHPIYLQPIPV